MAGRQLDRRGFDPERPTPARLCNHLLGGKDHFAADRTLAGQVLELQPNMRIAVRENRKFLVRAIRYLTGRGIRQYIDIGVGLPAGDSVDQMIRRRIPDASAVYADTDPSVLVHARATLPKDGRARVVSADLRRPAEILGSAELKQCIDFDAPVALVLTAVLHHIPEPDDPRGIVKALAGRLAEGSAVVVSHATADADHSAVASAARVYSDFCSCPLLPRSRPEIARFFTGLSLIEPGLVFTTQWRPDGPALPPELALGYAGIGMRLT